MFLITVVFPESQDVFHNETKTDEDAESKDNVTDTGAYVISVDRSQLVTNCFFY